jgi:hypothetical protein
MLKHFLTIHTTRCVGTHILFADFVDRLRYHVPEAATTSRIAISKELRRLEYEVIRRTANRSWIENVKWSNEPSPTRAKTLLVDLLHSGSVDPATIASYLNNAGHTDGGRLWTPTKIAALLLNPVRTNDS